MSGIIGSKEKTTFLLSTEAIIPLSPSASITSIGDDPGTSIGLEEIPEQKAEGKKHQNNVHMELLYANHQKNKTYVQVTYLYMTDLK